MFVRFVVPVRHEESRRPMGVIQAAFRLRDNGQLDVVEEVLHDHLLGWFNRRLIVPTRFSRSRRPNARPQAICWFRAEAVEHIRMVRKLVELLERHGVVTRTIRTAKPGYIVYEDRHQVAAVPFRDTIV